MSRCKGLLGCIVTVCWLVAFPCAALGDNNPAKARKAATPEQAVELLAAASKAGDLKVALELIAQPFHDVMLLIILEEEADDILRATLDQKFGKERRRGFRMEVKKDLLRIKKVEILAKDKEKDGKVKLAVRETVQSFQHGGTDTVETTYLAVKKGETWKLLRPFTALLFSASEEDMKQDAVRKKGPDGKETWAFKITFKKDLNVLGHNLQKALEERAGTQLPEMVDRSKRAKAIAEKVAAEIKRGTYKKRQDAIATFQEAQVVPLVKATAQKFLHNLAANKIDVLIKLADTPWFDGGSRPVALVKDQAKLKSLLKGLAKEISENSKEPLKVYKVMTYGQAKKHLKEKARNIKDFSPGFDVKLIGQVLREDDWVVILGQENVRDGVLLVKLRKGRAWVVGLM